MIGILIGFGLALALFGLQSLMSAPRPAATPTPAELSAATSSPLAEGTPTATPVLFQFNQIRAAVGEAAPFFTLHDLDGKEVVYENYLGKPIIINLWATWCKPCEYEMPGLQKMYEKYEAQGLVVLGVNLTAQDDEKAVREFVKAHGLTFPVLLDQEGYVSSALYGMKGLPMSYFIDANGILRRVQVGAMLPELVDQYTQEILPKK